MNSERINAFVFDYTGRGCFSRDRLFIKSGLFVPE